MLENIRYAIRVLVKTPTFTVLALVTLAIGIGANTAIFTLLNAALLKPLPFLNPGQILQIQERHSSAADLNITGANFRDLHDRSQAPLGGRFHERRFSLACTGGCRSELRFMAETLPGQARRSENSRNAVWRALPGGRSNAARFCFSFLG